MIRIICAGIALAASVGAVPPAAAQVRDETSYIGTIFLTSFDFCPRGSVLAEGQPVDARDFEALYSLIGTTYGSEGQDRFLLPNLRDKAPVDGMRYCIVVDGALPLQN